jgi:multidrug resistance efflux pump
MTKARRGPLFFLFLATAAVAAGFLIARPLAPHASGIDVPPPGDPHAGTPPPKPPAVVCLGHVDIDGGVTSITPPRSGRVVEACVTEGATVEAGTVLLKLDDRPARFEAEQARAAVETARLKLTRAEQELKQHPTRLAQLRATLESEEHKLSALQHQLERQQELFRINNTNAQEVRAAESQVKEQEAQVRVALERMLELEQADPNLPVREARTSMAATETRARAADYEVEQYTVRAPSAGTVLRVQTSPGEVVGGPGAAAPLLFGPDRPFIVRAEVEQEFVRRLAVGQRARVEDEAAGGPAWTGKVARIAGWYSARRGTNDKPSAFKDVPTVECVIRLDDRRPPLRIGQRVQVAIME